MKNGLKKFAKGMFAIFTIKLLIFGIIFSIQSCQTDSIANPEQDIAIAKFESIVKKQTPKIQGLVIRQQQQLNAKSTNSVYDIQTEEEAREIIVPIVNGTKELLATFDYTESELGEDFDDLDDPRIALIGLAILAANDDSGNQTAMNYASIFGTTVYAQDSHERDTYDCLLRTLGITALTDAINNGFRGYAGKAALKRQYEKSQVEYWVG